MSKENNLTDFLTDVADAIREKKGTSEKINPQDFSEEIRGIEGGNNWGHYYEDFKEYIDAVHPAFASPLQEDVDYYNNVVDSILNGLNTEDDYLVGNKMLEFKRRIAWIPKSFTRQTSYSYYTNLQYVKIYNEDVMDSCIVFWMEIDKDTNYMYYKITKNSIIHTLYTPLKQTYIYNFTNVNLIREIYLSGSYISPAINDALRGLYLTKLGECKLSKTVTTVNSKCGSKYTTTFKLGEIRTDINLSDSPILSEDSVKYMLDNCITKKDETSYTLTLHADVLARFIAKCTEGHEEYDAEYAAALASANEKGLTLA